MTIVAAAHGQFRANQLTSILRDIGPERPMQPVADHNHTFRAAGSIST
jgi:hypothetical protein